MKKLSLFVFAAFMFSICCCASTKVKRVDSNSTTDLSGYWNDTDVRIVSDSLIEQCLSAGWYNEFRTEKGKKPIIIVGDFRNLSDEHMDTSIISKKIEISLINSGKVTSVANSSERGEIRKERDDQQINSSVETAKNLGNETAADFMLQGTVKTIIDSNGKKSTRSYFVTAELVNMESNEKVWLGENDEIKKLIKRSSVRM